jgi:DNA-binding MarR family transcriptional regulator
MTLISRMAILSSMSTLAAPPTWSFLTNHARVLLCIARDPAVRLREIGVQVGITERAAYRIVTELVAAGYISRERTGRRNRYTVHGHLPLPDPTPRTRPLSELLAILTAPDG